MEERLAHYNWNARVKTQQQQQSEKIKANGLMQMG